MELHGGVGERDTSLEPRHTALLIATIAIVLLGCRGLRTLRAQADGDRDFQRVMSDNHAVRIGSWIRCISERIA